MRGQIEMLRDNALGNFRDILVNIAKDTAMLVWLDGRTNTRAKPQENFGREIMELFTMGVGHYTEADVYAGGARVHRLEPGAARRRGRRLAALRVRLQRRAARHRREDVQLSDLRRRQQDHSRRAPAADGMQDGLDLIDALAAQPEHRRAIWRRKLYRFFVSEFGDVDDAFVDRDRDGLPAERLRHEGGDARGAAVAASSGTSAQLLRALLLAGRVRRPRAEGHRLERASR